MSASILPIDIEVGKNSLEIYRDASDVDFDNETETAEFLRDHIGDRAHLAVNLFPYFSMPRFAVGIIGTARADMEVHDRQFPRVYTHMVNDLGLAIGYAHPLLEDRLSVGGSLKYVHRQSLVENYTVVDISTGDFSDKVDDDLEDGSGVLMDLGVIYTLTDLGFAMSGSA
jgi:aromatic ring-cleaving dioxygenase